MHQNQLSIAGPSAPGPTLFGTPAVADLGEARASIPTDSLESEFRLAGLVASPKGLSNPAFVCIPHDAHDLSAGSIQGYFDADSPDPRLPGVLASAIVASEGKSGLERCGDLLSADTAIRKAYSDPQVIEIMTIANMMISRLEEVGFEPDQHAVVPSENDNGPSLTEFFVKSRKRGRGIRIAAECSDGAEVSAWVESRVAARLFRKKDRFLLGWGGTLCDFKPPMRKSWRGWRSW